MPPNTQWSIRRSAELDKLAAAKGGSANDTRNVTDSCICGVFTVPLAQAFSLARPTGPANAPELDDIGTVG